MPSVGLAEEGGVLASEILIRIELASALISRMGLMVTSFGGPTLEDPLDIAPVPATVVYCFDDGCLNPRCWVAFDRLSELLSDEWRQWPNILLVQSKDVRPLDIDALLDIQPDRKESSRIAPCRRDRRKSGQRDPFARATTRCRTAQPHEKTAGNSDLDRSLDFLLRRAIRTPRTDTTTQS